MTAARAVQRASHSVLSVRLPSAPRSWSFRTATKSTTDEGAGTSRTCTRVETPRGNVVGSACRPAARGSFFQDRADWARNRLMRFDNWARKQTKPMQESESQDEEKMMIAGAESVK